MLRQEPHDTTIKIVWVFIRDEMPSWQYDHFGIRKQGMQSFPQLQVVYIIFSPQMTRTGHSMCGKRRRSPYRTRFTG